MSKIAKKLVLLDVHAIIHRAYHALPDFVSSKGVPTGALYGLSTMLLKIITDLKPDYIVACYDLPKPTYRHEAYKDYKAGRAKTDDELISQLKKSREIFEALNIPTYDKEGFEADDMIGTIVERVMNEAGRALGVPKAGLASKPRPGLVDIIIASGDMDTLQLVIDDKVRVYTLKKGIKDTIIYNEKAVVERFGFLPKLLPDYKGLRGDPSDNIIGIKGIGEKTAGILIQNFGGIEDIYKKLKAKGGKEAFKKVGITDRIVELLEAGEEEAQFSKMLGTIRRDAPIDFKLPEKTWVENLNQDKILAVWSELEFRTLGTRLKDVLGGKVGEKPAERKAETEKVNSQLFADSELSEDELKEAKITLWLINSNISDPKIEDLLNISGKRNLKEARDYLLTEIKNRKLDYVFDNIEKPLIPIIREMEKKGIVVDKEILQKLSVENHKILAGLEKKIWDLAGGGFNINSPKQMGEILFVKMGLTIKNQKKTAGGKVSTKESELEKMRDLHPIISLILEYRELQKMLSTYIDNIPNMVAEDGRLHAKFLQTGTTTGRMSSQEPNLQNIPNKGNLGMAVRTAFKADKGNKLVAFDYSQMEIRIAAFLSGDKKLLEIFRKGEDVHTAVAAEVFNVPLDKVDKEMRRKAKVINFGIMYGMGVSALKVSLGTDRKEAQKFYDDYFTKFNGLASYLDAVKSDTARIGYTETLFGRRRYFEGIKSKLPFIRAMAERMAINAPIQGTGADITKLAMIKVDEYLNTTAPSPSLTKEGKRKSGVNLLLQVHDELVYEMPEKAIVEFAPRIKEIMENVVDLKKTKGVVCKVEYKIGDNWGEMQKIKE